MTDEFHDLRRQAVENANFRKVVDTGTHMQVVLMSIEAKDEIGSEVHPDNEQIVINASGTGMSVVDGNESPFNENDLVLVRPGTRHNFVNTGDTPLKIITIYAPPHHPAGTVHKTKAIAEVAEKAE